MSESDNGTAGKPRRRRAAKPAERRGGDKVKATIRLTRETSRRLSVHAAMMDMDRSALVERILVENLRRYVVSDRGGGEVAGPPIAGTIQAA